jgi:Nucleotidyl transferase AbiEii toxin, Type IV TA system
MTPKQFFDWQTSGGTDDVMRMVDCLEKGDITWCAIGGVAVNHWAREPMVTQDVDIVIALESVEKAVQLLQKAGFTSERFDWSINVKGSSQVSIQISTEKLYAGFPARSVAADVHGILMRVASLEDTLQGKIAAWKDTARRQSKKIKDLGDIARLVENHPHLWNLLGKELQEIINRPPVM